MIPAHYQKVLCFFAHPDDETLAAGATLSRLRREGREVWVAIPATGVHARKDEPREERDAALARLREDCNRALGVLGVSPDNLFLGEFPDNEMDTISRLTLIRWLERLVHEIRPDAVFTHHRYCTNVDHRRCHEAAAVATRPAPGRRVALACGEVPSSTGYLRPTLFEPNLYVQVSGDDVGAKCAAMRAYSGEARPAPHPRSTPVLRALATLRGAEAGVRWAEAFVVVREVWGHG